MVVGVLDYQRGSVRKQARNVKEKGELKLGILCFYPSFLETSTFKLS